MAQPTQEEVFRSINDSVSSAGDTGSLVALICGISGLLLLLMLVHYRRKRREEPQTLNHPGKLLKEVAKAAGLKPAEVRHLQALADQVSKRQPAPLSSPLTLLLCPSLLSKPRNTKTED